MMHATDYASEAAGASTTSTAQLMKDMQAKMTAKLEGRAASEPLKLLATAAAVGFVLGFLIPKRLQMAAVGAAAAFGGKKVAGSLPPGWLSNQVNKLAVSRVRSQGAAPQQGVE